MEHVVIEGAAGHHTGLQRGLLLRAGAMREVLSLITLHRCLKGASRRLVLDPRVSSSLSRAVVYLSCRRGAFWMEAHMAPVSPVSQGAMEVIGG